ncbi:hypothetical protein [Ktedonobacter racemifer]|uniref:Uncharacterized protein n=1 Tax=Ktedonobacter racemifer DSM 44963 TaxID=485913 RepID=D6TSR8_KTERA|nr:hypothetical protein [Ktedonobacter racemifer]EFH83469.1 hypothetical protein Krac_4432 [Ktedonobacter racemifer DSM 44963]
MNFSALISFPASYVWLCGGGAILLIAMGWIMHWRATAKKPLKDAILKGLRPEAERWHVPEAALTDYMYSLNTFMSMASIGAGMALLLYGLLYAILLVSPAWSLICPFIMTNFLNNACFLVCIAGASIGGSLVLHHLQHTARATRELGPRRTLRDYRSPLFFWLLFTVLALTCVIALVFHVIYMPGNACLSDDFFPKPWQPEIIYPWIGLMFIDLLYVELLLTRIASVPSPIVSSSVPGADGIDDMFRSRAINSLQCLVLVLLFFSLLPISSIATIPYSWIIMLLYFLGFIALMFLFTDILVGKRGLGDRLPGAAWLPKRSSLTDKCRE